MSAQLHDAYANGRTYDALEGKQILSPAAVAARPALDALEWHGETVFRG